MFQRYLLSPSSGYTSFLKKNLMFFEYVQYILMHKATKRHNPDESNRHKYCVSLVNMSAKFAALAFRSICCPFTITNPHAFSYITLELWVHDIVIHLLNFCLFRSHFHYVQPSLICTSGGTDCLAKLPTCHCAFKQLLLPYIQLSN
jgi:hypothetical protein